MGKNKKRVKPEQCGIKTVTHFTKDLKKVRTLVTDGRPLSYRKTQLASIQLRKVARLVWVAITKYAPLKYIKQWATRRWQENVVQVNSFGQLKELDVITHIIANICPKKTPKAVFGKGWGEMV